MRITRTPLMPGGPELALDRVQILEVGVAENLVARDRLSAGQFDARRVLRHAAQTWIFVMQTTATFESAAPFAAGSVQVLVISVDAQLATSAASVTIPSAKTIPTRALSLALASMMFILRFAADSVAARVGRAPAGHNGMGAIERVIRSDCASALRGPVNAAPADTSRPCWPRENAQGRSGETCCNGSST